MIKKYKVTADGYKQSVWDDQSSALEEANRLSYIYKIAYVNPINGN